MDNITIEQQLENEGRVLTIQNGSEASQLQVYWNGDTAKHSKEVAENEEIFVYVSNNRKRLNSCSISLSKEEAQSLSDTLLHMIKKLDELR